MYRAPGCLGFDRCSPAREQLFIDDPESLGKKALITLFETGPYHRTGVSIRENVREHAEALDYPHKPFRMLGDDCASKRARQRLTRPSATSTPPARSLELAHASHLVVRLQLIQLHFAKEARGSAAASAPGWFTAPNARLRRHRLPGHSDHHDRRDPLARSHPRLTFSFVMHAAPNLRRLPHSISVSDDRTLPIIRRATAPAIRQHHPFPVSRRIARRITSVGTPIRYEMMLRSIPMFAPSIGRKNKRAIRIIMP